MRRVCLLLLLAASPLTALQIEPWGKDADLTRPPVCCAPAKKGCGPISWAAQKMIRFHQCVISPADGPRSHYNPSSSYYTLDAIKKYGFIQGFIMGCDRLQRENSDPWVYRTCRLKDGTRLKLDPIP